MSDFEKSSNKDYNTTTYVTEGGKGVAIDDPEYDAVFGKREEGQVNYKSMGWCVCLWLQGMTLTIPG
jgi:hypothetical protein